jgi:4-methyl-5(b-hydroxyethyl)-thiazole monophosphate biosynthesis
MSALVLLAPGFEEIEAITVIDILRRAEIDTVVAGLAENPLVASRGTRHLADVLLIDVEAEDEFEIVVLPGGVEGSKNLAAHPLVRDWLVRQRERGHWVAAICAAPTALLAHGWLRPEQKMTSHPAVQGQFSPGQVQPKRRVVVDGKLITSLAAGSAMEFAFEIVRQLRGPESRRQGQPGRLRRALSSTKRRDLFLLPAGDVIRIGEEARVDVVDDPVTGCRARGDVAGQLDQVLVADQAGQIDHVARGGDHLHRSHSRIDPRFNQCLGDLLRHRLVGWSGRLLLGPRTGRQHQEGETDDGRFQQGAHGRI